MPTCECKIIEKDGELYIKFCPLHEAAEDLLEACKFSRYALQHGISDEEREETILLLSKAIFIHGPGQRVLLWQPLLWGVLK
jgi:hypothetical protein